METMTNHRYYISTDGNDRWSGLLDAPNADGTDGPFATLTKARDALRALKLAGKLSGPVTVLLRGGRYLIGDPVIFSPDDSWPTTYAAYPGEKPILDGGMRIGGWRVEKRGKNTIWVVDLPEVAEGRWYFKQLFVNGERRKRPRLPKTGLYRIEYLPPCDLKSGRSSGWNMGENRFRCAPGDIQPWENISDVDVVALHLWIDERMPIASFDPETRMVTCSRHAITHLRGENNEVCAEYYVENVKEALSEPGEWYLDRKTGELCYIPMPGEDPETAEVYAPIAEQLLKLKGCPDEGRYIEHLRFVGLGFQHTEWRQPSGGGERWGLPTAEYANAPQAACHIPGVIYLEGACYCAIEDCTIEHVGWYGIELIGGCQGNYIVGNTLADLGAGGVKLGSTGIAQKVCSVELRTGNNRITDNHIFAGGRVFHNAVGILCMDSFGNEISHNHIHDLFYSGISCGWVWGYVDNVAKDNLIEKNHIHDLGHGLLSDMGGIYTLGVQPGTVIRGNLIHDVEKFHYGGWAIYTDEGSSHIIVENNIAYNLSSQPFHQHYGRENIIRNNILAFGRESQFCVSRAEPHISIIFERNIVVTDEAPLFTGGYGWKPGASFIISDLNLFWSVSGKPLICGEGSYDEQWHAQGYDKHSIVADPRFRDLSKFDFTLEADSPAWELGFQPIDMSDVGPRP